MAGNYRSTNVKFNLNDENQRRTWEYLQTCSRKKNGSYAKILSDAFIKCHEAQAPEYLIPKEAADEIATRLEITIKQMMNFKDMTNDEITVNESNNETNSEEEEISSEMLAFFGD